MLNLFPRLRHSTWCGPNPIPRDVTALPSIGCFELSAVGTIVGRRIDLSVDEERREVFRADGTVVTELHDPNKRPMLSILDAIGYPGGWAASIVRPPQPTLDSIGGDAGSVRPRTQSS